MVTELHNAIHRLAELAYQAGVWAVIVLSVVALLIFIGETARTIFRRETRRRPRRPRYLMM